MRARLLLCTMLLTAGACLEPLDPSSVRIAAVRVTIGDGQRGVDTIRVRRTTRVQATAFASQGYDLGVTSFAFTSSNTAVATVDQNGVVRGVSPGTATITARAPQGASGQVTVVVLTSTVEFTIPLGAAPVDIAFSRDYARAYVTTTGDSLVVVDAFGFQKVRTIAIGSGASGVAATADLVYVTRAAADSVVMVSVATNAVVGRFALAGRPGAVVASASRAFVAATTGNRIDALENGAVVATLALDGSPRDLAVTQDGERLFATVEAGTAWSLRAIDGTTLAVSSSIALPGPARAVAAGPDGSRGYVLLSGEIRAFDVSAGGVLSAAGSIAVSPGAADIATRLFGPMDVVVSGEPVLVIDGTTLTLIDQVAGGGTGAVAIRPDGLFAFLAAPDRRSINVIGL